MFKLQMDGNVIIGQTKEIILQKLSKQIDRNDIIISKLEDIIIKAKEENQEVLLEEIEFKFNGMSTDRQVITLEGESIIYDLNKEIEMFINMELHISNILTIILDDFTVEDLEVLAKLPKGSFYPFLKQLGIAKEEGVIDIPLLKEMHIELHKAKEIIARKEVSDFIKQNHTYKGD